jgi:hypothetical protein
MRAVQSPTDDTQGGERGAESPAQPQAHCLSRLGVDRGPRLTAATVTAETDSRSPTVRSVEPERSRQRNRLRRLLHAANVG